MSFKMGTILKIIRLIPGFLSLASAAFAGDPKLLKIDSEYLWPIHPDRQIQTISADAWAGRSLGGGTLGLYLGATLSHPWGHITQSDGDLNQGNFHTVDYDTSAFGAGPALLIRLNPFPSDPVSLFLDASGGVLLYDQRFPPGGDIYDFMFRLGPGVAVKWDNRFSVLLKYQWMHVSNGQGIGPFNPSYEAEGLVVGVQFPR